MKPQHRQQGFVLVVSLMIMVVITIVVFGASFTAMVDRMVSSNQKGANASYYVAQAGLQRFKTLVFQNLTDYYANEGEGWCTSPVAGGITDGDGTVILPEGGTTDAVTFGPGSYRVTYQVRDTYLILTSVGRVGNAQTALQLVATASGGPAGAWDNAILAAGTTPGSKAINGNVSVYGSVHIVRGDLEIENDAFSVSGTAGVYNNYIGEGGGSNDIRDRMLLVSGDSDVDLCSRVKIKSGSVFLESGSSVLGTLDNPLHSLHLGNGKVYDGKPAKGNPQEIATDQDDTHNLVNLMNPSRDDANVNSGYEGYDLELPVLEENFPTDINAFTITAAECPWLVSSGVINLPPSSAGSCGNDYGRITWHAGPPSYLEISGNINTGNLDVLVESDVSYRGKGRLRQGSNRTDSSRRFEIKGSLTPLPGLYDGVTSGGYPNHNVLAVETSGNIIFDTPASSNNVAMIGYAANNVEARKQVVLAGSLVANTFDLGTNVPKIAYHPDIRNVAEELCLIGSFCHEGEVPPNPGTMSDISIERRDTAAID